jgi:hypothetical protein
MEGDPVLFRIIGSSEIKTVQVSTSGRPLGNAVPRDSELRFQTQFREPGEFILEFKGFGNAEGSDPLAIARYRVRVVAKPAPAPTPVRSHNFNAYVLKAVNELNERYGLRGYNIKSQFTHELTFHKYGTMRPTGEGRTMCVAGVLEVMLTAFNIYSRETGDYSPFEFLPFESWKKLSPNSIKSRIWVNAKLKSAGTGDAVAQFGIGERLKFRDLEPGGFININRTTRTGHAVVFMAFIDEKGRELPRYSAAVAGFKYFGAQGRGKVGEGGFGFRHAFFSKNGCPNVPFKRDCNVLFSDNPRVLNVGQLFAPADWKHVPLNTDAIDESLPDDHLAVSPESFDGLTTDD